MVNWRRVQQLGGLLLGQLRFFAGDPHQPVARMDLEQQQRLVAVEDGRHRIVDRDADAGDRGQGRFALGERMCLFHRLAQRVQGFRRFGEQLADELPVAALAAHGQEHLRRRVHVLQAQFAVEQDHRGGQVVEQQSVQGIGRHGGQLFQGWAGKCKKQTRRRKGAFFLPRRWLEVRREGFRRRAVTRNGDSIESGAGNRTNLVR